MADTATVIFKTLKAKIGALELDATLSETHDLAADITEHPVEDGADVADNIRPKSASLTLEGFVTDTPLGQPTDSGMQEGRYSSAYQTLRALLEGKQTVTVSTRLRDYTDMAIESLSVPRDVQNGDALRFTVKLKQIRKVASKTVQIVRTPKAKPKTNVGQQAKTPTTPETTKSALKRIGDYARTVMAKFSATP